MMGSLAPPRESLDSRLIESPRADDLQARAEDSRGSTELFIHRAFIRSAQLMDDESSHRAHFCVHQR